MGAARAAGGLRPSTGDLGVVDASPLRCFDTAAEPGMIEEVKAAGRDGDSLGGVVEVLAYGVPPGIGRPVHWDRRLATLVAASLRSEHPCVGDTCVTTSISVWLPVHLPKQH